MNKTKKLRDAISIKSRQPKDHKINEGFNKEKLRDQKETELE